MEKIQLAAKIREIFGRKTNKERKTGLIPGVVYGKKEKNKSIWVSALELRKLLKNSGESTIIELILEEKEKFNVIINELQRDPVKDNIIHVDFYKVRMNEKIETDVPLEFVGEAPAVKELGGMIIKSLDEVPVSCFPADLPSEIEVDISTLVTFEDRITVANLKVSDKVEIKLDSETVVATVEEPRSQEEMDKLEEKVEDDVSKVEGIVKEPASSAGEETPAEGDKVEKEKK